MRREIPPCASGIFWEIASGDTLYKIAQEVEVSLEDLFQANPNVDPENLQIGQYICIPEGGQMLPNLKELPNCPQGFFWEIAPGDTLYNIARQNNISVQRIIAANPGLDPYNLQIGQFICLPID